MRDRDFDYFRQRGLSMKEMQWKTVVHTVNLAGSDEFTVHVFRNGKLSVDAVFAAGDKKSNRRNALEHARQLAFELRCKHAMNHGIARERWREFTQQK
jgi:hypothetical protein